MQGNALSTDDFPTLCPQKERHCYLEMDLLFMRYPAEDAGKIVWYRNLLTLMLLVAYRFGQYKKMQKTWKMTETLANGYSSESTQRELSNEYQHDRV